MAETLLWLYGITLKDAPAPDEKVRGIDDAPVRIIGRGQLRAVVSEVPASEYQESALNDRLTDLEWTGNRAVAHERVLIWLSDRTTVVPLAPFSLHRDEAALARRLKEWKDRLLSALERLARHREWGIRIWRDEAKFAGALSAVSSAIKEIDEQRTGATPGFQYLLKQRRTAIEREESARASSRLVDLAVEKLSTAADDVVRLQIPPRPSQARMQTDGPGSEGSSVRTLVLHAAFLVHNDRYFDFERLAEEQAKFQENFGFDWEFTGPWPAYHFAAF